MNTTTCRTITICDNNLFGSYSLVGYRLYLIPFCDVFILLMYSPIFRDHNFICVGSLFLGIMSYIIWFLQIMWDHTCSSVMVDYTLPNASVSMMTARIVFIYMYWFIYIRGRIQNKTVGIYWVLSWIYFIVPFVFGILLFFIYPFLPYFYNNENIGELIITWVISTICAIVFFTILSHYIPPTPLYPSTPRDRHRVLFDLEHGKSSIW